MKERGLKVLCMFMHAFRITEISGSTVIEIIGKVFLPLKKDQVLFSCCKIYRYKYFLRPYSAF